MKRQRYIAVLADESGKVLTDRNKIGQLVQSQLGIQPDAIDKTLDAKSAEATYNMRVTELGYDRKLIRAIIRVELGVLPYVKNRIVIRFELYVFQRLLTRKLSPDGKSTDANKRKYGTVPIHPGMPIPSGARVLSTDKGIKITSGGVVLYEDTLKRFSDQKRSMEQRQQLEYTILEAASLIDRDLAYKSTSFGLGQIMGFNARVVGYSNAQQMAKAFAGSSWTQKLAILNFIANNKQKDTLSGRNLDEAVKAKDVDSFARVYNGDKKGIYAKRINQELRRI
jgi:hypothetical protein